MTQNELKKELQRMMQKCPQCMTTSKLRRYTLLGKNRIYNLIHSGEIPAFIYQGTYVINKDDVIEYLLKHSEDTGRNFKAGKSAVSTEDIHGA
ncbi:MAG: helix-turn-helix domain-containing protein [Clostridia bacterium]|nr:helix-turn-helix domain-containing protein [Clostridia bacterium]